MNEKVGAESVPVFYIRGNHEIRNAYSMDLEIYWIMLAIKHMVHLVGEILDL